MLFGFALGCLAFTAFPYGATFAERGRVSSVETATATSVVPVPGTGMPRTDAVAVIDMREVDFTAFDEMNWQKACQTFDLEAQAGLTMRLKNGRPVWTGLVGGIWVDLEGVRAEEGLWQVRIEADYSLGAGRRRVRYMVSRDGSEFVPLSDGENVWLPMGADGEAFSLVQVAGFGETGEIVAQSGERPLSGTVATVENVLMDYSGLSLDVSVTETWGVEGARVTLKDESGAVVATRMTTLSGDGMTVDFSDVARPGGNYRADIALLGAYHGKAMSRDILSREVDLFTKVGDFGFRDGAFVHATAEGVVVSNGMFGSATGDAVGMVRPTNASDALRTTLTATLEVTGAFARADLPEVALQFALTLMRREDGSCCWTCVDGDKWTEVSGPNVPTTGGTYDVKVDLDYEAETVGYAIQVGGAYVRLENVSGRTAFALPQGKRRLESVAVVGGPVRTLDVVSRTVGPVSPTMTGDSIVLAGNASVDLESLDVGAYAVESERAETPYHLSWADGGGKYGVWEGGRLVVKAGTPRNGMSSYASYLLGLEVEDEASRPVLSFRPTADGTAFELDLPAITPRDERSTGVMIGYELVSAADARMTEDRQTAPLVAEPHFTVTRDERASRFYRVRIRFVGW